MATDRSDTFRSDTFADLLRRYRRALGLSQEKLAEKAGLSRRGVSDLERGLKQTPHTYTVDQLAHALGISGAEHVSFQAAARPRKQVMRNDPILLPSPADRARPPLVGRSGELALLDRHLAHVGPLLLLLAGEPGIGKSRLLQEAGERAAAAGWRVLRGGCQRRSAQAPYEPIVDALARHTMSRRARQLRSDLKGAHWLALLLPELAEQAVVPRPQWHLPPEQERRLMFAAVGRFLENVAGTAGTLLVLDDLQWAGVDALELLGTLLRQERDAPLRMVGTYRETEVRPLDPLTRFVADTVGEGIALRKQVRPLRETDAHALLAALLTEEEGSDAALCERIVRRSGGVPLFLVSYARGLQSGALHGQSETGEEIPWDLRQNVRQRVLALPEPTQRLLGVAAIAGREASLVLLAAASGHGEEELLAALEAADHARLLVASDGQTYRFVHDVIREVVEEDLSPMRRRVLHQKVAEALEQHSQHVPDRNPADLAFHFQEAGEPARALPYVMLAGDRAEQTHAYTEAERQYELSAELAHTVRNRAREVEAQRKRALVLMHHARYGDALEILERVVSYLQVVGDLDGELRAVAAMLEIHGNQGTVARGLVLAERLLAQIHPQPLPGAVPTNSTGVSALSAQGLADFYIGLAALYFYGGRYREELCAAEEAVQQARAAGDDSQLLTALHAHALASWCNDSDVQSAMPRFEELIARAQSRGFGMLLGRSLDFLANIEFFSGRLMCAQEHAQRAAEVLEECGADPTRIAFAWGECGNFSYYQGEWERARAWIERAKADMAKADPTGTAWRAGYPHIWNGKLRIAHGCARQGVTSLEAALAIATANEDLQALRHANSVLAESELVEGRAEAAYARLEPLLDRPGLREPDVTMRLLALAAWAELALGHVEAAEARVRECLERSAPGQCYFARPDARRVEALLAMKQGRWQDAAAALEEAISVAHAMPYPYAEAKALMVYGELEAARGEPEAGRRRFGTALDILSRLGERVYAKHIEQAMAALPLT